MHRQVTEDLDPSSFEPVDWLISQQELELEPGSYDLRIMAVDEATGRVGTTRLRVEIPKVGDDEWRLQRVILLELGGEDDDDEDKGMPVVQGRVRAGRQVTATVVVDGGQDPAVSAIVRSAGQPAEAAEEPESFSQELRRRRGEHRGTLALPQLPPGEYVLQLRITDPLAEREEVVEIPLMVVAGS